ncbi:protein arginine kinase [Wansuia hejianensis]|uniref:Protein-arginine kinase n=1 Tax=Wansuia hejianensis TaxID=2763667 RepID=A0A926F4A5_9FIRM|nr:protein arginine kinase [Wansuia hejianensis]MBC8591619.1 protein arginine kinase [Wansuia hejianensis]
MIKWLDGAAIDQDVVVSTRIRVARNLSKYKFPLFMDPKEADGLTNDILDTMKDVLKDNYRFIRTRDLPSMDQEVFVEKHLISPNMIEHMDKSSFLLRDDEKATIMINEEDHLRIQTLFSGFNLEEGWRLCSLIDDLLDEKLDYAYDEKWGYLTSCPTNVGTGLRASVMLHLPCISMTGNINTIIEALRKIGLTARGLYGEGSEVTAYLYQISNQTTLGESEEEIIDKLNKVVHQIINRERSIRNYLKKEKNLEMEDRIYRSYGIISNSRILSSKEAMEHLSNIRLGWAMGILNHENFKDIMELMIDIQPANIQKNFGKDMNIKERDIARAKIIREFILDLEG